MTLVTWATGVIRIVGHALAYGLRARRFSLIGLVVVGVLLLAAALFAKVVAPIVVYPFA